MGVDSSSAFLQRREEEERERRESQERQRRMMENFTNIPDQLRQSYFKRPESLHDPLGNSPVPNLRSNPRPRTRLRIPTIECLHESI